MPEEVRHQPEQGPVHTPGLIGGEEMRAVQTSLRQILDFIENRVRVTDATSEGLKGRVEALDKLVRGDGVDGLITRVAALTERQENNRADLTEVKAQLNKLVWYLLGILLTTISTLVVVFIGPSLKK